MDYTHSITSKGQITIPKSFRNKLGLDEIGMATIRINDNNEIVISAPKTLQEVRTLLNQPLENSNTTLNDIVSEKERLIGAQLAKKYNVR